MQASTDSLDTMVNVDTAAPLDTQDSISQPSTNNPAPDESINSLTIPYTLDIQQEDNLSIDVLKLYQDLLPSKDSYDKRVKFVNLMERLLNAEWPDHDIKANVFGSSVNDLGTSSSDVDLCVTTVWNGLRNVRVLAKLFRKCGMQHVVCVPRAKVPIVRLFDPELQISCDINVNNTIALQNTKMIKTYVALDSRVRPLIMTIKHWTKQRSLNDAANGGTLSSYTWTCMIINFLQQRQPPILPVLHQIENQGKDEDYFYDDIEKLKDFGLANKESLGGLLFAFFRRFAIEFDYDEQVVSVRQGRYLTKQEKGWDTGRNKMSLCVEEPFNMGRNLGNSADIASVHGLRCEFQRFLDLLIAGDDLESICSLYQPLLTSSTEIPTSTASHDSSVLSLTLPAENRTSSFFLPIHPYTNYASSVPAAHPYDRRRSMVDGICSYPSPILSDSYSNTHFPSYTYRAPPISKPPQLSSNTFHPRFSSPQALDSILKVRNTRHGSHPLPPVPSTLLSMLNISANHGTEQSVEKIFARYQRKQQTPPPPQQQHYPQQQQRHSHVQSQHASEGKGTKKTGGNSHRRKNQGGNNSHAGNGNHHPKEDKKPRRRSSGMEWPTISTSVSTPGTSALADDLPRQSWSSEHPQRSRRWSTTKKQQQAETVASSSEPKKRTLAEIVKVHTPPLPPPAKPKPQSPAPSMSTSSNKSNGKSSNNRRRGGGNSNGKSNSQQQQNKQKKKNIKPRS
ncbi:hypothetical protein PS15m_007571 [Mucor circinelloides]